METKKKQEESRRQQDVMRQFREAERIKNERLRREKEKEDKLNDWVKKKEEDIKCKCPKLYSLAIAKVEIFTVFF